MKDYFEVSVTINPSAIELVTEIFFERFECEGVVQAEEKYKKLGGGVLEVEDES